MKQERLVTGGIPAILWGDPSDRVSIRVHGRMSRKEYAQSFAAIADSAGISTGISYRIPSPYGRIRPGSCTQSRTISGRSRPPAPLRSGSGPL